LLSQQGAVPLGELVEELIAAVGDEGGEVIDRIQWTTPAVARPRS
jgi:hypothetical protein